MKKFKPVTPGLRERIGVERNAELSKNGPCKSLLSKHKSTAGRNCNGRITVRHRGSGVKRRYRMVDFLGQVRGTSGLVESIEYDPIRTAYLGLIKWGNGQRTYMLHYNGMKVGDVVEVGKNIEIKNGNRLALEDMPTGIKIHNIELTINKGGQLVRSAGAYAILMAKNNNYATIKLPSGENRLINIRCMATIGEVGNSDYINQKLGKAGKSRHLGIRPTVRGSVMNPCDHPHGGGEGKCPIGQPSPRSPTGVKALGYKTINKKKTTSKYIIKRRK
jgi:large subunit ribosomal protein L2